MEFYTRFSFPALVALAGLLFVMAVYTLLVLLAQVGCLTGRPFENPDGTRDDWSEQKVFFGIAWADLTVACPTAALAFILIFLAPRWGLFLLSLVAFWFLWANVMTTVTSLRFERPALSAKWFVVFPTGAVVGLGYIVWMLLHFRQVFMP